jgi:chaperonin GroES
MATRTSFENNIREEDMLFDDPQELASVSVTLEPDEDVMVELEDGSVIIDLDPEIDDIEASEDDFDENLVGVLPAASVMTIGQDLLSEIDDDLNARRDWERTYKDGIELLGLKYETRTEPWIGACGVYHPMILEAAVRFQSETMMETFPAHGPVLTKVLGKETREKLAAAARVRADMNYQLTERMVEFRDEHDRMLLNLPIIGSAFKKVYFDPTKGRMVSKMIDADNMILPYGATNARAAERVSHRLRYTKNKLEALIASGFYAESDLGDPQRMQSDVQEEKDRITGIDDLNDDRFTVYECVVLLTIDEDSYATGLALPYVVTICRDNDAVLGIRRNWRQEDKFQQPRQHFVQYDYIPGMGAYGLGLIHLIGGYAKAGTSIIRQLVDAGTLSNLPGGLKSKGMRIKGDDQPIRPGEFRDVDVGSGTVRDNIIPLPYKEPSTVLHMLLKDLIEEGRRLPGMADMKISDMSSQAPVGTTLALIERQLKVMSAVQARTHNSLKDEFKLIKQGVSDNDESPYDYEPASGKKSDRAADYALVSVVPVSDPNSATMTQRLIQYQAAIQLSQSAPQLYDLALLHRDMLETIGFKNAAKLVPLPEDINPMDPVLENMRVLRGDPIKAFLYQDHAAHMQVHQAAMQDPVLQQTMGQNPQAQVMMGAMQAHIAEHMGFMYRQEIEAELGVVLPPEDEEMPPDIEAAVSKLMARAAMRLLQRKQAQAQAQQAQQAQQDPVIQIQMRDADRKDMLAKATVAKTQADIADMADRSGQEAARKDMLAKATVAKTQADIADMADKSEREDKKLALDAGRSVDDIGLREQAQAAQQDRDAAAQLMQRMQQQNPGERGK